jgi:hypothetical protein
MHLRPLRAPGDIFSVKMVSFPRYPSRASLAKMQPGPLFFSQQAAASRRSAGDTIPCSSMRENRPRSNGWCGSTTPLPPPTRCINDWSCLRIRA